MAIQLGTQESDMDLRDAGGVGKPAAIYDDLQRTQTRLVRHESRQLDFTTDVNLLIRQFRNHHRNLRIAQAITGLLLDHLLKLSRMQSGRMAAR